MTGPARDECRWRVPRYDPTTKRLPAPNPGLPISPDATAKLAASLWDLTSVVREEHRKSKRHDEVKNRLDSRNERTTRRSTEGRSRNLAWNSTIGSRVAATGPRDESRGIARRRFLSADGGVTCARFVPIVHWLRTLLRTSYSASRSRRITSMGRLQRGSPCRETKRRCRFDAAFRRFFLIGQGTRNSCSHECPASIQRSTKLEKATSRSSASFEIGALDPSWTAVKRRRLYSSRWLTLLTRVALTATATATTATTATTTTMTTTTRCSRRDRHAARCMFRMRNANCRAPPEDESFIRGRRASIGQALALARSPGPPSPPPPHPPDAVAASRPSPSSPLPPVLILPRATHPRPLATTTTATAANGPD